MAQDPATGEEQPDPRAPIAVSVDFGAGNSTRPGKEGDKFQRIGIYPRQVATVTVQYPTAMAGDGIVVETLDGGRLLAQAPVLAVDSQGELTFRFQAGEAIGHSRISLYNGDMTQIVQFWVIDRAHPDHNPKLARN